MTKLYTTQFQSPLGFIEITSTKSHIKGLRFNKGPIKNISNKIPQVLNKCLTQLEEYFTGNRKIFKIPINMQGTPFQQSVWEELKNIPHGKTLSYGELAKKIGKPKACRAVGMANNRNQIPIIVPCHRVIGADGKLVGYAPGLSYKEWLLAHEGVGRP
ncbi:MAG: cysteine methyltransferase [Epsilonproteobacteria bacterium]|nr:MAG: cysteine methyltransferase [Campylobacterota bacterium]RLA64505.1 MAG: cysteine methyltransferase [Campylobacterota bacterium]